MNIMEKILNSYKFYITTAIAVLLMITTLISVGFGALNQNLNIAGDVEYKLDESNMIRKYDTYENSNFHSSTYIEKIKTVDFLDNNNIPNNAVASWNVSKNSNGKVRAWIIDDPNNTGYYKLYIGANGDVVANPISSYIFYGLLELETINFNNNFDTSRVTNMSGMFKFDNYGIFNSDINIHKLKQINGFEYFDTSNVTNMSRMFYSCNTMRQIRISSLWNISSVTNSSYMFYACTKLPNFNSSYTDASRAKPTTQGGYLTLV